MRNIYSDFFIKKEVKLSDLEAGQQITVVTDEDIKNILEFKAVEITLQSTAAISPATAPIAPAVPPSVPVVPVPLSVPESPVRDFSEIAK